MNGQTKNRSGNTTILDTGTTLLLVSDDVVDEIYGMLTATFSLLLANARPSGAIEGATYDDQQGGYKFPSNATIPDIEFAVGDQLYKVNPKDIAFGDAGDGYTFGGIQSRGNLDFDIFGDIFLKSVYVVSEYPSSIIMFYTHFDLSLLVNQGETKVGLAQRDD